jgi:hypothetical protein
MKSNGRDRIKPAEAGLIELCDVALTLIHERQELLKLLRADAVSEERDDVFNATLKRLKDLGRISHQLQLAFRNSMGIEDGRGRVEAVGEQKRRAFVLHGPSTVRQESAGAIVHGDCEVTSVISARTTTGTVVRPNSLAAAKRPWPAMTS